MSVRSIKKRIIENIIIRGTLDGALSRNHIYGEKVTPNERREFRIFLSKELLIMLNDVLSKEDYNDRDHYRIITAFSNKISRDRRFKRCLANGRLRIGTSQKLINLYWKMNWLFKPGIKVPLHCPFDSIIIRKLDRSVHHIKWTKSDEITEYKTLVAEARKKLPSGKSIAEWELETYGSDTIPNIE